MNRYTVYIPNCRPESDRKIFAVTSFAARQQYIADRNTACADTTLEVTDVCAVRDSGGL